MKFLLFNILWFLLGFSVYAQYNIVFIESDDQSNQTIGAFGNTLIKTPNMDRLASEGIAFTAAYNMGCWSPAVCIPSRTMLFYGKYLWDSQKITKTNAPKALPELLKDKGYNTYMTGKWHAWGKPPNDIFDDLGSIQPGQLKTYHTKQGHVTDITGQEAVSYIKSYKHEAPFFLYVGFNAPHVPRQTKQKYYDMYPTEQIQLPPSVVHNGPLNPNIKYNYTNPPIKHKTMKSRVQQNNAMVSHMDERVGDILNALQEKGLYDKTIIVFMSDHGISFGENGVAGKVCLYEPSVTAPLIIKAPNLDKNKIYNDRVYLQDITPTLLNMLDIEIPHYVKFQSLIPIIKHNAKPRASIYLAMFDDQRGIIRNNKKLIMYPKSGDIELYDLEKDPWETKNLKNTKGARTLISSLIADFKTWQKETGDTLDISPIFKAFTE
ncbi:sulfatase-like hydrolase/transferase [Tamlana fucoidanivorans]|uniref:DUF229 domain-containing protein n=1 Tax=Allotamlana fucoidanivorans TaxID=2583814 RepID=A0A5C4SQN5_9FLAO|nr:sulfatase-like hydrolase/transferase [Tamlana fucoidanivorans]TNJ46575.1 DUF229 domain-containing protein [Tamlana fucoidanivorans]